MSKMFVHYKGTVAEFKAAGLESTYTNHIVFIKGGEASGNGEAVYTHGQYYANVKAALAALQTKVDGMKYFSKIKVGETVASAPSADGTITFSAEDPSVVTVNVGAQGIGIGLTDEFKTQVNTTLPNSISAVDAKLGAKNAEAASGESATAFGRIKNLENVVAGLTGTGEGGVESQITNAIEALDVNAKEGDFVASISQVDGKIEATMGTFNFDTAGSAATAEANAKAYADSLAVNYDAVGSAAQALTDAKAYADSLADNYDEAGSAATALAAAQAYADGLADNYDEAGSAAQALTDAKAYTDGKVSAINAAAETLAGRVSDNEEAIDILNGEGDGSVKKSVADAIAGVVADAPENFDTLKEVADWIASDTTGAAKMQTDIATLKGADTVEGSVAKTVKDAVAAEAEIARAAEQANASAIAVLNGEGEGSVAKDIADAKAIIDAYTINGQIISSNPVLDAADINYKEADGETAAVTVSSAIATLEAAVGNGGSVDAQIDAKIQGLDAIVTSVDGFKVEVKVTEVDGIITAVNVTESDIASASGLQGVANNLAATDGKVEAIKADYLKAADKTELDGKISTKVAQTAYDTKIAELEAKDAELEGFWAWEEL